MMTNREVCITYLYNSGFALETERCLLIFDYCLDTPAGPIRQMNTGVISAHDLYRKPVVVVFVSHNHKDHFNAAILRWKHIRDDIYFVLSHDVYLGKKATHLSAGESISFSNINIEAFSSTDAGISFFVEVDGVSVFHAGDLNLWNPTPKGSTSDSEALISYRKAKIAFLKVVESLRGHIFDIVFFPVDPRIGDGYDVGALYFAEVFKPKVFIPMHFGDRFDVCEKMSKRLATKMIDVVNVSARGQQFVFKMNHFK